MVSDSEKESDSEAKVTLLTQDDGSRPAVSSSKTTSTDDQLANGTELEKPSNDRHKKIQVEITDAKQKIEPSTEDVCSASPHGLDDANKDDIFGKDDDSAGKDNVPVNEMQDEKTDNDSKNESSVQQDSFRKKLPKKSVSFDDTPEVYESRSSEESDNLKSSGTAFGNQEEGNDKDLNKQYYGLVEDVGLLKNRASPPRIENQAEDVTVSHAESTKPTTVNLETKQPAAGCEATVMESEPQDVMPPEKLKVTKDSQEISRGLLASHDDGGGRVRGSRHHWPLLLWCCNFT